MCIMRTTATIGTDMSCFQSRQSPLLCNCTPPSVNVSHKYAKSALPKSGPNALWLPISLEFFCQFISRLSAQTVIYILPKLQTLDVICVVGFEGDDIRTPTCWLRNPIRFVEKERLS